MNGNLVREVENRKLAPLGLRCSIIRSRREVWAVEVTEGAGFALYDNLRSIPTGATAQGYTLEP
jgi:hypothetical protein